ncbi:MAG: hypothetical protein EOO28_05810 [Comamonadaceae bacterium]|nr:MAG: hypothetical protein EOO28_05810 [Comamonadaceae bacterium]
MNPSSKAAKPDEDLSITGKNRHQYYETAIASASDSDRLIRQAEARGHQRMLREEEMRRNFKRLALGVVALVIACCIAVWFLMTR